MSYIATVVKITEKSLSELLKEYPDCHLSAEKGEEILNIQVDVKKALELDKKGYYIAIVDKDNRCMYDPNISKHDNDFFKNKPKDMIV